MFVIQEVDPNVGVGQLPEDYFEGDESRHCFFYDAIH